MTMPHVDTTTSHASAAVVRPRSLGCFADPDLWGWLAVALMALLPLHAALVAG
jgi:hypothetical protein